MKWGSSVSKIPKHIQIKIEQYIKYSHKANKLRNEIDSWFASKGVDTIGVENHYSNSFDIDGATIQDILIDAGLGTGTTEEIVKDVIQMIEINMP
jgi:hypothetical protein